MALSSHLLMLYIGIETVSIVSFVMAGFSREDSKSNEASFKYLVFGGLASGLMIYGFSLLYGIAGSLQYSAIAKVLVESGAAVPLTLHFSLMLVFGGLFYKISAFPMHFWAPDVYEGPRLRSHIFLGRSQSRGLRRFIANDLNRFCAGRRQGRLDSPRRYLARRGLRNYFGRHHDRRKLSAIGQRSTKRLFAYSSIAHVGYMLMGLITFQQTGLSAILFYLVAYCAMNIAHFGW